MRVALDNLASVASYYALHVRIFFLNILIHPLGFLVFASVALAFFSFSCDVERVLPGVGHEAVVDVQVRSCQY